MSDPPPAQPKQTPGRRRAPRTANRKNYASENDASGTDVRSDFTSRVKAATNGGGGGNSRPMTPQKGLKNAGTLSKNPAPSSQPNAGKSGRRNRNKEPPKNISTSPAPPRADQRTPPRTAGAKLTGASPAAVPVSSAFAGATFHASPAPSSLPLPSFFTKTNSPGTPTARPASGLSQQPSPPASDSELPSATATASTDVSAINGRKPSFPTAGVNIPPTRDESPLDMLFRADQAEKERNRRASAANVYAVPTGLYSPPRQVQPLPDGASGGIRPQDLWQQQQAAQRSDPALRSSSGISAAELNGTPGRPIGPAFSTPFQERIRAARSRDTRDAPGMNGLAGTGPRDLAAGAVSVPSSGSAPAPVGHRRNAPSMDDRSEALKRFLFSKTGAAPSTASSTLAASEPATPVRYPSGPSNTTPQTTGYGGSPYQNAYSPYSASPTPNNGAYAPHQNMGTPSRVQATISNSNGSSNVAAMEDSLRQILKLDSPFGNGTTAPGLSRQP